MPDRYSSLTLGVRFKRTPLFLARQRTLLVDTSGSIRARDALVVAQAIGYGAAPNMGGGSK